MSLRSVLGMIFSLIFSILVILLLIFYLFFPFGISEFDSSGVIDSSFKLGNSSGDFEGMQFYSNMRYPDEKISYKIYDCPLQKKGDMERAFNILENLTILKFMPVLEKEEISIKCDSKSKIEEGLFIAGEGGPSNITVAGEFNVISKGQILLLRKSSCARPNVALHELLHALGFDHSKNKDNIMYPVSECSQTVGNDVVDLINQLYSIESNPDLLFWDVEASMHGRYLNLNMTIKNFGLKDSGEAEINIYVDGKSVKKYNLNPLKVGTGSVITLTNIRVSEISVEKIELVLEYDFEEIDKENNKAVLFLKK